MTKKQSKLKVKFTGDMPSNNVLVAKISNSLTGKKISFPHRYSTSIDTGVSVSCPEGYKLGVKIDSNLANRGMLITNLSGGIKEGPIKVVLLNAGREIVEINDGNPIAEVFLESDFNFEFESSNQ